MLAIEEEVVPYSLGERSYMLNAKKTWRVVRRKFQDAEIDSRLAEHAPKNIGVQEDGRTRRADCLYFAGDKVLAYEVCLGEDSSFFL